LDSKKLKYFSRSSSAFIALGRLRLGNAFPHYWSIGVKLAGQTPGLGLGKAGKMAVLRQPRGGNAGYKNRTFDDIGWDDS
jgi:hypothetical protein